MSLAWSLFAAGFITGMTVVLTVAWAVPVVPPGLVVTISWLLRIAALTIFMVLDNEGVPKDD